MITRYIKRWVHYRRELAEKWRRHRLLLSLGYCPYCKQKSVDGVAGIDSTGGTVEGWECANPDCGAVEIR